DAGTVTISVTDHRPGLLNDDPARAAHDLAEGGRGLYLVNALSAAWGTTHSRAGKTIWFTLTGDGTGVGPGPGGLLPAFAVAGTSGDPPGGSARLVDPAELGAAVAAPAPIDLAWLLRLSDALLQHLTLDEVLTELLYRVCQGVGADGGALWI